MSITELEKMGYSRTDLKAYVHVRGFPCIRTQGGGKILIETDGLDEWIKAYQKKVNSAIRKNKKRYYCYNVN